MKFSIFLYVICTSRTVNSMNEMIIVVVLRFCYCLFVFFFFLFFFFEFLRKRKSHFLRLNTVVNERCSKFKVQATRKKPIFFLCYWEKTVEICFYSCYLLKFRSTRIFIKLFFAMRFYFFCFLCLFFVALVKHPLLCCT